MAEWKCQAVLMMISSGHESKLITDMLKGSESFVMKVKNELIYSNYDLEGVAPHQDHAWQPDTKMGNNFVALVQEMVKTNSGRSMRGMSRKKEVD